MTPWRPTHTCEVIVTSKMQEPERRTIRVRVGDVCVSDEQGRIYDKHLSGAQIGVGAKLAAWMQRRLDLRTLRRIRVRL